MNTEGKLIVIEGGEGYPSSLPEINRWIEDGKLKVGGALPCCTAGGLLSEGHLMGMGHIVEAVRQLRGESGERQVEGAGTCFVSGYGGAPHTYPVVLSYTSLILRG